LEPFSKPIPGDDKPTRNTVLKEILRSTAAVRDGFGGKMRDNHGSHIHSTIRAHEERGLRELTVFYA
jgi:hypothetical protein